MYHEFFGLRGKPFQLSPDVRFFFPSKEHKRALAFLEYGLSQGDGFIVVTGDVGTGKTTIVQNLLQELVERNTVFANIVITQLSDEDLLHLVALNFSLEPTTTTKAALLHELEKFLVARAQEGKRVLLIVDEAQNLDADSLEALRMLSNFQRDGQPLLQVFLLGQQELRDTLLSPGFEQLRQRVIATYHLNPLDAEETRTYIEHRLSCVDWSGDPGFTEESYRRIHAHTGGVPRRINNLCDRILLYCYLEERHQVDEEVVDLIAEEIGNEFRGVSASREAQSQDSREDRSVIPTEALEAVARTLFDKADVVQRLSALERAIDTLGHGLKEELAAIRATLNTLAREVRDEHNDEPGRRRAR